MDVNIKDDKEGLRQAQGESFEKAVEYTRDKHEFASVIKVDYIVTLFADKARGIYMAMPEGGEIYWQESNPSDNQHIEVIVQDQEDFRFIPYLDIFMQLFDDQNGLVGQKNLNFAWHPTLYHYGENWIIPKEGNYMARIIIKSPTFYRHSKELGKRYEEDVSVDVGPVYMKPGRM